LIKIKISFFKAKNSVKNLRKINQVFAVFLARNYLIKNYI